MKELPKEQYCPKQEFAALKTTVFILIVCLCLFFSCYNETTIPVNANFKIEVAENNYAVPATIGIVNQTTGADWYRWQIDGGATYSSTQQSPGQLAINQTGTHTITLTAGNRFEQNEKSVSVTLDATALVNFTTEIQTNSFAPVTVKLNNTTVNGEQFVWHFPGAQTERSTDRDPAPAFYAHSGKYTISLEVTAGRKTYTKEQQIEVLDSLKTNFDYRVDFIDEDMQAPVKVYFQDKSTSTTARQWTFAGGSPAQSNETNPVVTFNEAGPHRVQLVCSNQKTEQAKEISLQLLENSGMQTFSKVKLGIFAARNSVGSFFSFSTGKVYPENELSAENITDIDLVFFGFSSDFKVNRLVSPSEMANYGFIPFSGGRSVVFYNSTELCSCNFVLTASDFDAIKNGGQLKNLDFQKLDLASQKQFDNSLLPRLVPFVTSDGRKGIIRVNQFITDLENSYLVIDVKVEKPLSK